jgi:hypothetical protein
MEMVYFSTPVHPDWENLIAWIRKKGTPSRVHHIELFLDDGSSVPAIVDGRDRD